ncbi:MAG: SAM-dependent chlorinase/fluorinase [Planctomycetes bacterium]|nr:SAM-dependent chlorinase/fluorinase [Planctomycetota bacterium]
MISLLTDFGTRDVYAGVLHAVIGGIAPGVRVVDLTHEVAPQDVTEAAFLLDAAAPWFPPGTVHVCVVDPGVGSDRRILCARTRAATFLAPDNGLLTRVLERAPEARLNAVVDRSYFLPEVSSTFHGRDVFAPVAARLALGLDPAALGPEVRDPLRLSLPPERALASGVTAGEVVHVDRYGNLITNLRPGALGPAVRGARVGGVEVAGPVRRSYAEQDPREGGGLLLITGSTGLLEVAVRDGSAQARLGVGRGAPVEVEVSTGAPAAGAQGSARGVRS